MQQPTTGNNIIRKPKLDGRKNINEQPATIAQCKSR